MKIIIKMFKEMSSGIVNVPEETGYEFRIHIPTPVRLPIEPWKDGAIPPDSDMATQMMIECVFVYTGTCTPNGIRIYYLNDIMGVSRDGI